MAQSSDRAHALSTLLRNLGCSEVRICCDEPDLPLHIGDFEPDALLLDYDDLPSAVLEQLSQLQKQCPTPVALFCQDTQTQTVQDAVESGLCSYVLQGVHPEQVCSAISMAQFAFSALNKIKQEAAFAKEQLEERKKVDQAKHLLMDSQDLSESQAFSAIRKLAMDRNRKLREAADDVLAMLKVVNGNG